MKRFIALCVIAIVCVTLGAGVSHAQLLQYGLKAGLNIASLSGDEVDDLDSRMGLAVGGYLSVPVAPSFSIQPELLYSMKGASDSFAGVDVTLKLDYLEIPVLAKYTFGLPGAPVKPSIFAGPALGLKLSSKVKVEGFGESEEEDLEDVKDTDFGLVFGAGLAFNLGSNSVGVDVRYNLGLTSIDDTGEGFDVKNNVISLMVSFGF